MWAMRMAEVRGVMSASISAAPALKELGAASATTGTHISSATGIIPPGSVSGGQITSEPTCADRRET